jgi:hypothetical protein
MRLFSVCVLTAVVGVGCGAPANNTPRETACPAPVDAPEDDDAVPVDDTLPPERLLRRASLVLRGVPPTIAELDALQAAGDEDARYAHVDAFVDAQLNDPVFYKQMFELGFSWMHIPLIPRTADAPEYGAQQQVSLRLCDDTTTHPGAWHKVRESGACDKPETVDIEPWWAPGTTITLVGAAANTTNTGVTSREGNPVTIECNGSPEGSCGCGAHAIRCHPDFLEYAGFEDFLGFNALGQRRQLAEEPARLFAHLAFFDRSLDELILGHQSVGTTNVQAAYVQQGIVGGRLDLFDEQRWWKTEQFIGDEHDPLHTAGDAESWREYDVSTRNPFFLAERDTTFDPRVDEGPLPGIPAAGVLTSLGFLNAYPRERLRAARALEIFACEQLDPPQGLTFNEYRSDPAVEGSCQHCHRRIDPAAIHFKRYGKSGSAFEGFGASYLMPGVGTASAWHPPARFRTGEYPYGGEPYSHWNRWYTPGTKMTPVTEAEAEANPEAIFIDFLPPDQTLLGQVSDGTVGPSGFAKMVVASGAFDRCVVRQLHKQVVGRDIDPTTEVGYLDALTATFVDNGRRARPFIKHLTTSATFRSGL